MSLIEASHVLKEYEVIVPRPGAKNVLKNIFCPDKKKISAVSDVFRKMVIGSWRCCTCRIFTIRR